MHSIKRTLLSGAIVMLRLSNNLFRALLNIRALFHNKDSQSFLFREIFICFFFLFMFLVHLLSMIDERSLLGTSLKENFKREYFVFNKNGLAKINPQR